MAKKLLSIIIGIFLISFISASFSIDYPIDSTNYSDEISKIDLDWSGSVVNATNSGDYTCWIDLNENISTFGCLDPSVTNDVDSQEGNNTWTVYVNDSNNSVVESESVDFWVDSIFPTITIITPATNPFYVNQNYFLVNTSITEENPDKIIFSVSTSGGSLTETRPYLNEIAEEFRFPSFGSVPYDTYTYTITTNDTIGHLSVKTGVVILDATDPIMNITTPSNSSLHRTNVSIETSATDDRSGINRIEIEIDGNSLINCSEDNCDVLFDSTSVADGFHELNATTYDNAGNSDVASIIIEIDNTAPNISLTGNDPQYVNVSYAYVESGAAAWDVRDNKFISGSINSSEVNTDILGNYTVYYSAKDEAGNTGYANRTVSVVDTTIPIINLTGDNPQYVEFNTSYVEQGANVSDNYDSGLSAVINSSTVDVNVLGDYNVTYNVMDNSGNTAVEVIRTITVVDTTSPVITLIGSNPQYLEVNAAYVEQGATASDNYDGNLTANITINSSAVNTSVIGSYNVSYYVEDSFGNNITKLRTVNVGDSISPTITLIAPNPQTIERGHVYVELNATADDNYDGNLTASIAIDSSAVNTNLVGDYNVSYYVEDAAGNNVTELRLVEVRDTIAPEITIINPIFNTTYDSNKINLDVITNEPATWEYSIDAGVTNISFNPNTTITLSNGNGNYNLYVYVTDTSGNQNSSNVTFIVNKQTRPLSSGGSCSTIWNCTLWSEWSECAGTQNRTCLEMERVQCRKGVKKSILELGETRECFIPVTPEEPNMDEEEIIVDSDEEIEEQGFSITGSVIGFAKTGTGILTIVVSSLLALAWAGLHFYRKRIGFLNK